MPLYQRTVLQQVDLRHSRGVNMFYFSGLSFRDTQRVWVFRVWVFETSKGLSFSGLSFRDTRGSEFFRGLSFRDTRGSEFFGSEVWVFEVWVFETPVLLLDTAQNEEVSNQKQKEKLSERRQTFNDLRPRHAPCSVWTVLTLTVNCVQVWFWPLIWSPHNVCNQSYQQNP